MKHKVYIMIGPSGSGKSTWIADNMPLNAAVCSADSFFIDEQGSCRFDASKLHSAHTACQRAYGKRLYQGWPVVVVDNTNLVNKERKFYVKMAQKLNYEIHYIAFKCDDAELLINRNTKGTPQHIIERHIRRMSIPEGAEIVEVS